MDPRLVDLEVEKDFRERSRWGREMLPDTFFRSVALVLLCSSAVDVLALDQRLRVLDAEHADLRKI